MSQATGALSGRGAKTTTRASNAAANRKIDAVSELATWREHVVKESKIIDSAPPRPFSISAKAIHIVPEKPTQVPFEARCPPGRPISQDPFMYTQRELAKTLHAHGPDRITRSMEEAKRNREAERAELIAQMMAKLSYATSTPKDKYEGPMTTNQEYGWYSDVPKEPEVPVEQGGFNRSLKSSPMTQFVDAYTLGWGQSPFTKSLNARATSTRAMAGAPSTAGAGKK